MAEFVNDTGQDISGVNLGYTGEEWRVANTTAQSLTVQAFVGTTTPDFSRAPGNGGWTSETINTGLTFTSPVGSSTASSLNGHLAANQSVIGPTTLDSAAATPLVVPAGSDLFICWRDVNDGGVDDALGIDNVTVSFTPAAVVPEPVMIAPMVIALGMMRRKRRAL